MAYTPPTYGESGEVYTDNVRNSLEAVRTTADSALAKANSNDTSLAATSQTADEAKEIAEAAKSFVESPTDGRVASLVQDSTSSTGAALSATFAPGVTLPASNATDDTAALNAVLAAHPGKRIVGRAGEHYRISEPLVVASGTTLDMTGCTITLLPGSQCNMLRNTACDPATTSTGTISAGSNVLTTALASQATVGQSVYVRGAGTRGEAPLSGIVGAVDTGAGTITVHDHKGAEQSAITAVTDATVDLYDRDSDITIIGGTWNRGPNGWGGGVGFSVDLMTTQLKRIDRLCVRDMTLVAEGDDTTGGGWQLHTGDLRWFTIDNITFDTYIGSVNTDGVNVEGPATWGAISNVFGTTGDDFVSLHCDPTTGGADYNVTAGDIQHIDITNVCPTDTEEYGVKLRAEVYRMRDIAIRGIHGKARGAVSAKAIGAPANNVSAITVSDVDCDCDGLVSIYTTADGAVWTLRNLMADSDATTSSAHVYVETGSTMGKLLIDGLDLIQPGARGVTLAGDCEYVEIRGLSVPNPTAGAGAAIQTSAGATVGHLVVSGADFNYPSGTAAAIGLAAAVPLIDLFNVRMAEGGSLLYDASNTATASVVNCDNITVGSDYIASVHGVYAFNLTNVNVLSSLFGLFLQNANSKLAIRGQTIHNPNNKGGLAGTAGTPTRVVHPYFRCDVSAIARNQGDQAWNTNGALACGTGSVICNGTSWKNLYTGAEYTPA